MGIGLQRLTNLVDIRIELGRSGWQGVLQLAALGLLQPLPDRVARQAGAAGVSALPR